MAITSGFQVDGKFFETEVEAKKHERCLKIEKIIQTYRRSHGGGDSPVRFICDNWDEIAKAVEEGL